MYYKSDQLEFPFIKDIKLKEKEYYYDLKHCIYNELTKDLQELVLTSSLEKVIINKIKEESRKTWEISQ